MDLEGRCEVIEESSGGMSPEVNQNGMIQSSDLIQKKPCPLEMSMRAANINREGENVPCTLQSIGNRDDRFIGNPFLSAVQNNMTMHHNNPYNFALPQAGIQLLLVQQDQNGATIVVAAPVSHQMMSPSVPVTTSVLTHSSLQIPQYHLSSNEHVMPGILQNSHGYPMHLQNSTDVTMAENMGQISEAYSSQLEHNAEDSSNVRSNEVPEEYGSPVNDQTEEIDVLADSEEQDSELVRSEFLEKEPEEGQTVPSDEVLKEATGPVMANCDSDSMHHDVEEKTDTVNESAENCYINGNAEVSENQVSEPEQMPEEKSLVLKIRKIPPKKISKFQMVAKKPKERWLTVIAPTIRRKQAKTLDAGWSDSDDEPLSKFSKNDANEGKSIQKLVPKPPKCCPRRCYGKIRVENQELAYRVFREVEEKGQGDKYLANCVQLASSQKPQEAAPKEESPSLGEISIEIANESNGNQSLSDEIQNAIRESLKDQGSIEKTEEPPHATVTQDWNYFIAIKNRLRMVCHKFLVEILRIDPDRLNSLKQKILAGEPLERLSILPRMAGANEIRDYAKRHLENLPTEPVPFCSASPPHLHLLEYLDRATLFARFKEFYLKDTGTELKSTFDTYRRFLQTNTTLSFAEKTDGKCTACNASNSKSNGDSGKNKRNVKRKRWLDEEENSLVQNLPFKKKITSKRKNKIVNGGKKSTKKKISLKEKKKKSKKQAIAKNKKKTDVPRKPTTKRGDVFSLMYSHLKSMPSQTPRDCKASPQHKFFSPSTVNLQFLYEEYRKYFLKTTNSELGLRFTLYESLFVRNPRYAIQAFEGTSGACPRCSSQPQSQRSAPVLRRSAK